MLFCAALAALERFLYVFAVALLLLERILCAFKCISAPIERSLYAFVALLRLMSTFHLLLGVALLNSECFNSLLSGA